MPFRRSDRPLSVVVAIILLVSMSLATGIVPQARAAAPDQAAAQRALDWLRAQQQPDGSFSAFGGPGDPGTSADAAFAFAAAGHDPHRVHAPGGVDLVTYLEQSGTAVADDPGLAAKVALALHASGANPRDAGGTDLTVAITSGYDPATGWYGRSFYGHALAVLALDTLGVPVEPGAVDAIAASRTPEGAWGFAGDTTPGTGDSNTTALVIQTLVAIDGERDLITAGLDYLRSLQDEAGAIAYDANFPPLTGDANSTALAIQAFVAAGEDPAALPKGDLVAALRAFQNPSGAFQYQPAFPDDSLLATTQAVPALLLRAYPIAPVPQDNPLHDAAAPAEPIPGCDYHEPTRHNVCGRFAAYWREHGGLAVFGYALTEETDYFGLRVQYFERARMEWHPELAGTQWEVLLTRLGAESVERDNRDRMAPAAPQAGCVFHEATRHNVCGAFATMWESSGGLPIFGYPLTEAFDADGMTVQYFERARFELQPGAWPERLDVLFGLVGAEALGRALAQ